MKKVIAVVKESFKEELLEQIPEIAEREDVQIVVLSDEEFEEYMATKESVNFEHA